MVRTKGFMAGGQYTRIGGIRNLEVLLNRRKSVGGSLWAARFGLGPSSRALHQAAAYLVARPLKTHSPHSHAVDSRSTLPAGSNTIPSAAAVAANTAPMANATW